MNNIFLLLMFLLVIILMLLSLVIGSFGVSILFGAPFVATKQKMMEKAFVKAGLKEGQSVTDIGCGDGSVLLAARKSGAGKLVGYEINPILAYIARFRLRGGNVTISRENMFNSSLEKTDVIFMYLFPKAVDRLRAPLSKLPQTTRVISRGFPFTGVIPMRSFKVDGSTFYIYHVKDLA